MASSIRDIPKELKQFHRIFEKLQHRTGWGSFGSVFDDFLTISVCALSAGRMEEQYFEVIGRYNKNEIKVLVELFSEMINVLQKTIILPYSTGMWYDFFGDYYMFIASNYQKSNLGQFFSPPPICDMMARMIIGKSDDNQNSVKMADPSGCGSGRMILAAGAINPKSFYCGVDLDRTCVKMTALNMLFHNLKGEVSCKNGLDPEDYRFGYRINKYLYLGIPLIEPMPREQSFEIQMWQQRLKTLNKEKAIELARKEQEEAQKRAAEAMEAAKGTLFEEMHQEFSKAVQQPKKTKKQAAKKQSKNTIIHQQTTLF